MAYKILLLLTLSACAVEQPGVWIIGPEPEPELPPVVMLLHGDGQTPQDIATRWAVPGDVIAPSADGIWNASTAYGTGDDRDDITALADMIEPGVRAIVMGEGNGGFMAWRLVCSRPDRFAVAVMLNAAANSIDDEPCVTTFPVSTLHVHGTVDPIIQYGGGQLRDMASPYPSVAESTEQERAQSTCERPAFTSNPPLGPWTVEAIGCDRWEQGHRFGAEHWRVIGWDHAPVLEETWGPAVWQWAVDHD